MTPPQFFIFLKAFKDYNRHYKKSINPDCAGNEASLIIIKTIISKNSPIKCKFSTVFMDLFINHDVQ